MQVDGGCHCGKITYEAEIDPAEVSICHCNDCQRLTGTAFRVSVAANADDFRILRGSPKNYIKVAESGARRLQAFCGDCATPLFATDADQPSVYGLRVGSLTQRAQLKPTKQIWRRSALPWVCEMTNLTTWPGEDE